MTAIYFILGYLSYALLYALTGSTVSKPEDIQSANSPVAILAVIGFYLSYFTMMNPTSELNVFASLFPISSPFCMPFRIMMGLANTTDVVMSIAILIVTIIVIASVAIKIYSNAILNYGTKWHNYNFTSIYNKMEKFNNPNRPPEEMKFYTWEEFKQFISVIDDIKWKALFEVLFFCGLRRSELRGLTWDNIDFYNNEL